MNRTRIQIALLFLPLLWSSACSLLEDPATSIAFTIESEVRHLGNAEGARYTIRYEPPAKLAANGDSYLVQFDKVGALIVWYMDANGKVTESATTTFYARFLVTPQTYKLDKPGNAALLIDLERQGSKAVIIDVR
jgi:hypothetical protein